MTMRVSQGFLDHLCDLEGLRTNAYTDSSGVRTIGCGHTGAGVRQGTITIEQAYALARQDIASFEACIHRNVLVPLTPSMFDALVSIAYNMGCGGLIKTGVVDLVNQKKYEQAGARIRNVGTTDRRGVILRGLVTRREIESAMFMQDGLPTGAVSRSITKSPLVATATGRRIPTWSWWIVGALAVVSGSVAYHQRSKK